MALKLFGGVFLTVVCLILGAAAFAVAAPAQVDRIYQLTIRESVAERYRDQCHFGASLIYGEARAKPFCGCMVTNVYSLSFREFVAATRDHRVLTEAPETRACNLIHLIGVARERRLQPV